MSKKCANHFHTFLVVGLSNQGFTASFRTFDGQWKGEILEYLSLQTIRRDHQLPTTSCPLKLPNNYHLFMSRDFLNIEIEGVVVKIIFQPPLLKWISFIYLVCPTIVENFSSPPLSSPSFYIFVLHSLDLMDLLCWPSQKLSTICWTLLSFSLFLSFQFCPKCTFVFKAPPWFAPRAVLQPTPWPRSENRSASPPATATPHWGPPRQ